MKNNSSHAHKSLGSSYTEGSIQNFAKPPREGGGGIQAYTKTKTKELLERKNGQPSRRTTTNNLHVDQKLTSPGLTHPTAGETVSGAPVGTTNSNDVAPTATMGPEPILGTG